MNSVNLMGRLTRDPELRQTDGGISFCNFSIAVSRDYKNKSGEYEADFINCVAFKHTADFITKYFSKGSMAGVSGRIQTRKWDKDGETRYATEIVVSSVSFAGEKKGGGSTPPAPVMEGMDVSDDDLPF